jgi:hypothetical protein
MPPQSPATNTQLAPPPEGIYRKFEDLLASVQKSAKDQGYGIVKLRASNYREGKPTRYDLVCDRGGVKYTSTAKKRTPTTRKIDCPWRAKAVCEVNLGNQWRFAVQESRHNHEARPPTTSATQEQTVATMGVKQLSTKVDQYSQNLAVVLHDFEERVTARLAHIEKRLETIVSGMDHGRAPMLGGNGVPDMGNPNIPTANMGSGPLTNGGLGSGGLMDNRLASIEARVNAMEQRASGMDGLQMIDDDPAGRLSMMVSS